MLRFKVGDLFKNTLNVYLLVEITDTQYKFHVPTFAEGRQKISYEHRALWDFVSKGQWKWVPKGEEDTPVG